jgi:hypothetical protein
MAWKTLVSDRGGWLRDTNAMLVSACCHFSMLIVVALVSVVGSSGGDGSKTVVNLGKSGDSSDSPTIDDAPLDGGGKSADHSPLRADHQIEAALGPAAVMDPGPLFTTSEFATKTELDAGPLVLPTSPAAKSGSVGGWNRPWRKGTWRERQGGGIPGQKGH